MKISKISARWKTSTIRQCIDVFNERDQIRLCAVVVLQVLLGGLDLIGVAVIGLIGALSVSGIESQKPGNRVTSVLRLFHLENSTFQAQVVILAIFSVIVLVLKTTASVYFSRKTLHFISNRSALLSTKLVSRLLSEDLLKINSRPPQETVYALTTGVSTVMLGVIGTIINLISDLSLLIVISLGLFLVDPVTEIATLLIFTFVGYTLHLLMQKRATKFGNESAQFNISSSTKIIEVLSNYREAFVRNTRGNYAANISEDRYKISKSMAELAFMPNVSKYVIEATMIISAISISGLAFYLHDAKHAFATLSIFIAASTRISPAVLRVQQGLMSIKSAIGGSIPTLKLIRELPHASSLPEPSSYNVSHHLSGRIEVQNLSFQYPGNKEYALRDINLTVKHGSVLAIVGPSGAGKTTFVDLLLGVLNPTAGEISIDGLSPLQAILSDFGSIGYVPQNIQIIDGTIKDNLCMGIPVGEVSDEECWEALSVADLYEFTKNQPLELRTIVGNQGSRLSGGQRQRLGLARAFLTKPRILVLDEATSALDAETEKNITNAIEKMRKSVTLVIIAHRLSTVKDADTIAYFDNGKVQSIGSFDEIRELVPAFDRQANIMNIARKH